MWEKDSLRSTRVWRRLWPYVVLFALGSFAVFAITDWWVKEVKYRPLVWVWARLMEPFDRMGHK